MTARVAQVTRCWQETCKRTAITSFVGHLPCPFHTGPPCVFRSAPSITGQQGGLAVIISGEGAHDAKADQVWQAQGCCCVRRRNGSYCPWHLLFLLFLLPGVRKLERFLLVLATCSRQGRCRPPIVSTFCVRSPHPSVMSPEREGTSSKRWQDQTASGFSSPTSSLPRPCTRHKHKYTHNKNTERTTP